MTPAVETSRSNGKPVEKADPGKGNNLNMTTACTAVATRISIALHATAMTKGKALVAMTMIQLHEEQREVIVAVEIHYRMSRAKGMTLHHPTKQPPWWQRWWWQPSQVTRLSKRSVGPEALRRTLNKIAKSQTAFFLSPKCFG
jgi:hypothetical protein